MAAVPKTDVTCEPGTVGSNPTLSSKFARVAEWMRCRSSKAVYAGSNPAARSSSRGRVDDALRS